MAGFDGLLILSKKADMDQVLVLTCAGILVLNPKSVLTNWCISFIFMDFKQSSAPPQPFAEMHFS